MPRCRPGGVGKKALEFATEKIEDPPLRRQCILYSHHELNVRVIVDQSEVYKFQRAINMRKVEYFDFRQNSMLFHLSRKALNEACRVLVDDGWEIYRSTGQ